jgi:hypothetical protein
MFADFSEKIDAFRIAVGERVYRSACYIAIHGQNHIEISYKDSLSSTEPICHVVSDVSKITYYLNLNDSVESDTSISDDDCRIECVLCVAPSNTSNDNHVLESFIIEIRTEDFLKVIEMFGIKGTIIESTWEEIKPYFQILEHDTIKQKSQLQIDICSPKIEGNNPFLIGKKDSDILLTFPFNGTKEDIEKCADSLTKAGYFTTDTTADLNTLPTNNQDTKVVVSRTNSFEIRVVDYASLEPGEWLNDTMIDFWLQWYVICVTCSLTLILYCADA